MAIRMQGNQVAGLRRALGVGVNQLASVLGVHPSTVHRWEAAGPDQILIDGVAASVLVSMAQKLEADRRAKQAAAKIGDEVAKVLVVGGALAALGVLITWLSKDNR